METMKKQFVSIRAKRMALGEDPQLTSGAVNPHESQLCEHPSLFLSSTETRRKASALQRNLGYPLVMLLLLALTVRMTIFPCVFFFVVFCYY